jgi:hypothetical protein
MQGWPTAPSAAQHKVNTPLCCVFFSYRIKLVVPLSLMLQSCHGQEEKLARQQAKEEAEEAAAAKAREREANGAGTFAGPSSAGQEPSPATAADARNRVHANGKWPATEQKLQRFKIWL